MNSEALRDGARLASLRDTRLVDAEQDRSLTRLNRLAVELLDVPVSLLTLVEEDRQFFAGQVGLPEPWASVRGTPLSHSFCQHVVIADGPLVVADARLEPRLADNLAIRDFGVVAYAGMPLRLADGQTLGSFCAIDSKPRAWSAGELGVLDDLTALATEIIELRRMRTIDPLRDPLTGLPARALFHELLDHALRRGRRDASGAALLAIDLDGFRLVNDALGHACGDRLLIDVAERLSGTTRSRDAVCRADADHFLLLCEPVDDEADAMRIAQRIHTLLTERPYDLDGSLQHVDVRIGVAHSQGSQPTATADELLSSAGAALAKVAAVGDRIGGPVRCESRAAASRRLILRNDLGHAHERGETSLVYQPIVALSSGRLTGVEALLRWEHPRLGAIAPADFIPLAESSGAIVPLGEWVLERACADLARWRARSADDLTVAVNVAAAQLGVADFPRRVLALLERFGLPGTALNLELTERTLLDEAVAHHDAIEELRRSGVEISLDDFGTGYSALAYLTRFPVDVIKIDRSFVARIGTQPSALALVRGIVAMADALGLRTVAEGVETDAQRSALATLGCPLGQGYLLGQPVDAERISQLLAARGSARTCCAPSRATAQPVGRKYVYACWPEPFGALREHIVSAG